MCAFRRLATIFSSMFDRKLRLDIGRYFFNSFLQSVFFIIRELQELV